MSASKTFIQVADEPGEDPHLFTAITSDDREQAASMTYLAATSMDDVRYFAQIQAPALWLNRNAIGRFDPASLETLERIARGQASSEGYFRRSQAYSASILAERRGQEISAPTTRPQAGSLWQLAAVNEIGQFLGLPAEGESIAQIAGISQAVEIRIGGEILRHHILSAGTTGSGKTNTNVRLILAAQTAGNAILVYDPKPDYSLVDQPSDEAVDAPKGLTKVKYWALGTNPRQGIEQAISVRACNLDPAMLATAIFYRHNEDLQAECAEHLLTGYTHLQEEAGREWSLRGDFLSWLHGFTNAAAAAAAMPFPSSFNDRTFQAVRQKFTYKGRIPSWIDANVRAVSGARAALSKPPPPVHSTEDWLPQMKAGDVNVIRIDAESGRRSYALFLDYAMRKVAELRRTNAIPGVMQLIDEAADIFKSPTKRLRDAMTSTVDEQIRKGRSLNIGFVISAQSAEDVPEEIRHNLNSVLVFRHRQPGVLKAILPDASPAIITAASWLRPGEALIQLFKTFGLQRCRMYPSPARLFKPASGKSGVLD
jgi:hypothetical protein